MNGGENASIMPIIVEPGLALNYLKTDPEIEFGQLDINRACYVIGLNTFIQQWPIVEKSLHNGSTIAIEKTDESVITQWHVVQNPIYNAWIAQGKLKFITGGDAPNGVSNLNSEHFLAATSGSQPYGVPLLDYNRQQSRPHTFLFTNRKVRPHRRYLIHRLNQEGLLDHALWCNHEGHTTWGHPEFNINYTDENIPVQSLPAGYDPVHKPAWIDGIIINKQFMDTWFSLVTETVFESTASFRTEKFYKSVLVGHPFVICANTGFYKDLHNLGFQSFGHLIDESFDVIINGKDRIDRLVSTVKWLCQQDLAAFWKSAKEVCLYNQRRALELHNSQSYNFTQQLKDFMHA
jgi:hypothetical protein